MPSMPSSSTSTLSQMPESMVVEPDMPSCPLPTNMQSSSTSTLSQMPESMVVEERGNSWIVSITYKDLKVPHHLPSIDHIAILKKPSSLVIINAFDHGALFAMLVDHMSQSRLSSVEPSPCQDFKNYEKVIGEINSIRHEWRFAKRKRRENAEKLRAQEEAILKEEENSKSTADKKPAAKSKSNKKVFWAPSARSKSEWRNFFDYQGFAYSLESMFTQSNNLIQALTGDAIKKNSEIFIALHQFTLIPQVQAFITNLKKPGKMLNIFCIF